MTQITPEAGRVIVSFGLYRSASTWTFNVLRALLEDRAPDSVYAETMSDLSAALNEGRGDLLVKCHAPDKGLKAFITYTRARTIITVRDPLDCIASFMKQFACDFAQARERVEASCRAILAFTERSEALILRYETAEDRDIAAIRRIAAYLDIATTDERCDAIARGLTPEAVRGFIASLAQTGYFDVQPAAEQHHAETHWHPNHVGDGRIGGYRDVLTDTQIAIASHTCRRFRERFAYGTDDIAPALAPDSQVPFDGYRTRYCAAGFSHPEEWGIWTEGDHASLRLPLARPARSVRLQIPCVLAPVLRRDGAASAAIQVNGHPVATIHGSADHPERVLICAALDLPASETVEVAFVFRNIAPAEPVPDDGENRHLGLGLSHLHLDYA